MGYARYRFETRFDPVAAADPPPEPAETVDPLDLPTHSERTLQAALAEAREHAFADGFALGRADGQTAAADRAEAVLAHAMASLSDQLDALDDRYEAALGTVESHAGAVVVALVRRFAPRLLDRLGRLEIEAVAEEALRAAGTAPYLRLRVHPDVAGAIQVRLDRLIAAGRAAIAVDVTADPAMAPHAVDASWSTGGLRYDLADAGRALDELCERTLLALDDLSPNANSTETPPWPR